MHCTTDRYFFGFSRWKRGYIVSFFPKEGRNYFCTDLLSAQKRGLDVKSEIYIWGRKSFDEVEAYAKEKGIALFRVEDGFVRSVSLGSDLTKPYLQVIDSRGIYFDPTQPSDLEHILNTQHFDEALLSRAKALREYLVEKKISKYNASPDKALTLEGYEAGKTIVVVPGQVEDDASIVYGADGMRNIALLQAARERSPEALS